MRFFTTLLSILTLALTASAQVVLVNSPASISGSYEFRGSETWAVADLNSGVWTADAVFIDDGTAPNTDGCTPAVNAAALAGKIALIDRGVCEFGAKALAAQNAGAIAVVIFNNTAGAGVAGMGAGAVGATVTIPVVMLTYEAGQSIRTTLETQAVNMTIGNVVFDHDLSLNATRISNMFNGVTPADQAEALGLSFTPGAEPLNKGLNDATSLELQAVITHTPPGGSASQVYDESGDLPFLEKDSAGFIGLPVYTAAEGAGVYNVTYSITSNEGDTPESINDNELATSFVLSKNVYSKARWDEANDRPFATIGRTVAGGGNVEFIAGFEVPNGLGHKLDSIQFQIFPQTGSLGTIGANSVNAFVYEWEDASADDIINNDELTIVGYAPVTFADTSATSAWVKAEILDYLELEPGGYIIPGDDKKYFVGVRYEGASIVFFGFDDNYDQTVALDNGLMTRDIDLPYIVISAWANQIPDVEAGGLFTGVRGAVATALYINEFDSPSVEVTPSNVAVTLSPNPASSQLIVESKLNGVTGGINYTIRDNAGRMVHTSSRTLNNDYDKANFDVSQYPAGQYFIVITTDRGVKAERFTVQH